MINSGLAYCDDKNYKIVYRFLFVLIAMEGCKNLLPYISLWENVMPPAQHLKFCKKVSSKEAAHNSQAAN